MSFTRLEHFNITVPDIDAAIGFIGIIAADFKVRRDELSERGYRWVHIGNEQSYIALQEPYPGIESMAPLETYRNLGVNHIGLVIEDAARVEKKLLAKGYKPNGPMLAEPHRKRLYFYDRAGFEWELVEYLSDNFDEKYHYE